MDPIEERLNAADTAERFNRTTEASKPGAFVIVDGVLVFRPEGSDGTSTFDDDQGELPDPVPGWTFAVSDPENP